MKKIVGITGGIGSGKSTVSSICRAKGYNVYDCDSNAKLLMTESEDVKDQIIDIFGNNVYNGKGNINRKYLANIIFNDVSKREQLNNIVHSAVREDINRWIKECNHNLLFIESAILCSSSIDKITDLIWLVEADEESRIQRVIKRNNTNREEVILRINSQRLEYNLIDWSKTKKISNNEDDSLILQINQLINQMS